MFVFSCTCKSICEIYCDVHVFLHMICVSSSGLAWDMSAVPDGLTELEGHEPEEKLEAIFKDHRDASKSKRVGSLSHLQSAGSEVVQEKSKLQPVYPCNISTITEESGSYKSSSSSSSRLTVSSASSK